jgi:hypothetical protein
MMDHHAHRSSQALSDTMQDNFLSTFFFQHRTLTYFTLREKREAYTDKGADLTKETKDLHRL